MDEEFEFIDGTDLYLVSNFGIIYSLHGGILKPMKSVMLNSGYAMNNLFYDGRYHGVLVAKEVASRWVKNPDNLPVLDFKDGNRSNCHYQNLFYRKKITEHIGGDRGKSVKLTHIVTGKVRIFPSMNEAARFCNVAAEHFRRLLKSGRSVSGKYLAELIED